MMDQAHPRRLAAIVALDMAGFSARMEKDEAVSEAEVVSLRGTVAEITQTHEGRVFNTAGDGFMLEFGSGLTAVKAAMDLAEKCEPKVRVGVHLGDVHVQPNGDLLGHGVNVAARLMARSAPGTALISAAVHETLHDPIARRLVACGTLKLEKMNETLEVFAFAATKVEPVRQPLSQAQRNLTASIVVGVAFILVAGVVGWFVLREANPGPAVAKSVAVEPFAFAPGDEAAQQFAALAPSEIEGVLTENQLQTVARGAPGGSRQAPPTFVLRGSVSTQGGTLLARIEAIDAATDRGFWSDEFKAPLGDSGALRRQVGWAAAQVFSIAADAERQVGQVADDEALALYVQARQFRKPELGLEGNASQRQALAARVVKVAPRFSAAHSLLGLTLIDSALVAPSPDFTSLIAQARDEAHQALKLDGHNGEAYLILAALEPGTAWSAREAWIRKAMAVDPDDPTVLASYAYFLSNVGRLDEAVSYSERGIAQRRCEPALTAPHGRILYDAGKVDEAISHLRGQMILRPDDWCVRWVTLETLALQGPVDQAEALLNEVAVNPLDLSPAAADAWRSFLTARRRPTPSAREAAASAIKDAAKPKDMLTCGLAFRRAVSMLAELGEPDAAFQLARSYAELYLVRRMARAMEPEFLFGPDATSLRRDSRFIGLADELGLLTYWRRSGRWPDFCAKEPQSVCGEMKRGGGA